MKHIILKVSHEKFKTVKSVIKEVKELSPRVTISPIKQGNLGDDVMASFSVDDEHYQQVVENLKKENIDLFGNSGKNEKKQIPLARGVNVSGPGNSPTVETQLLPKNDSPASVLDFAIKNGDYEKVIQYSKDFRKGFELIKKAKDNIDTAIKNSIEITYNRAIRNKFEASTCLAHLIKIASDKELKTLNKTDQIKSAGLKAVELCSIYSEYMNVLVQICNNNAIPHIVCMKGAIKLAFLLDGDDEKAKENMDYAVRYLNVRWLNIVFYTVSMEISEKEKEIFRILIDAIKEKFGKSGTVL